MGATFIRINTKNQKIAQLILNRPVYKDDEYISSILNPFTDRYLKKTFIHPTTRWENIKILKIKRTSSIKGVGARKQ